MKSNSGGFTLIELLIAMSFFSFLLLFITFGYIQINRSYNKGLTIKNIQESSRGIIEEISREIRVSNASDVNVRRRSNGTQNGYRLCLSGVRYAWNQHEDGQTSYTPSTETLTGTGGGEIFTMTRVEDSAGCLSNIPATSAKEVLDPRATIQYLDVAEVAPDTWKITLVVSTKTAVGQDLEVFGKDATCKVGVGDQFCDVAKFETVVSVRN